MATSLKHLSETEESVHLKRDPTYKLFGMEVDVYSTIINTIFIIFTLIVSFYIQKSYKIFTNSKILIYVLIIFLLYLFINIFTASIYSADLVYESQTLIYTQDGIFVLLSICMILFAFFTNVSSYIHNDDIVFKLLTICIILLAISLYTPNTTQSGRAKRLVRKIKENLYRVCIYLFIIIMIYGTFSKRITK